MQKTQKINDTIMFGNPPSITFSACVGGKKESKSPIANCFDKLYSDNYFGKSSWEKAETYLVNECIDILLKKSNSNMDDIDFIFSGDLENQCTASAFAVRNKPVQYVGLYGACSTMAESLCLASCFTDANQSKKTVCVTSSHFCTAEKQFRTPLDYGGQRTPTAQWTVTASGAVMLEPTVSPPYVRSVTFGRICDYGITDINNMGAAMAPAAASTLLSFFKSTNTTPDDYDCIYTGDLGEIGTKLLSNIMSMNGIKLKNHKDCGLIIYDVKTQDVGVGGSGCGCSASVLSGHIIPMIRSGKLKKVLFMATGALMSPTTVFQKDSIPAIAHLVELSHCL